jgi:hypothetical protein
MDFAGLFQIEIIRGVVTGTIILIITLLANRYFVERKQMKIQHSKDIAEKVLRKLDEKINNICIEGFQYNFQQDKFAPKELLSYDEIPHYEYLKQHFTSGYPMEWCLWQIIEEQTREINRYFARLSEKLRQDYFLEYPELKEIEFFYKTGRATPNYFIKTDHMGKIIIDEIMNRLKDFDEWILPINVEKLPSLYYSLSISPSGVFMKDKLEKNIENCKEFIEEKIKDEYYIKEVTKLFNIKQEKDQNFKELRKYILKIIANIELGDTIKGKCTICSLCYVLILNSENSVYINDQTKGGT